MNEYESARAIEINIHPRDSVWLASLISCGATASGCERNNWYCVEWDADCRFANFIEASIEAYRGMRADAARQLELIELAAELHTQAVSDGD